MNELIHTPLGVGIDNHHAGQLTSLYGRHVSRTITTTSTSRWRAAAGRQQKVRALVGEEGPEIVDLPWGAFVPRRRSRGR